MEDEQSNIAIKQIKEVKMTSDEKARMIKDIMNSPISAAPMKSPYLIYSFMSRIVTKRTLVYAGSAFSLFIIAGSGAVFASTDSLPGSILYPFKVNVVERMQGALIFSPVKKVEFAGELATKRLVEAETLAREDRLDEVKEAELNTRLTTHTEAFTRGMDMLRKNRKGREDKEGNRKKEEEDLIVKFQASLNAYAETLEAIERPHVQDDANEDTETSKILRVNISGTARARALDLGILFDAEEEQRAESQKEDSIQTKIKKEYTETPRTKEKNTRAVENILRDNRNEGEEEDAEGSGPNQRNNSSNSQNPSNNSSNSPSPSSGPAPSGIINNVLHNLPLDL